MEKISVIIPVHNAEKTIESTLNSLIKQTDSNYEIIVVDDASTDNSVKIASKYKLRIFELKEQSGPAYARNFGARNAEGGIVAFTDADCIAENNWLSLIRKHIVEKNKEIITGGYKIIASQSLISRFIGYDHQNHFFKHFHHHTDVVNGGNFAARKNILMSSPGLEEDIFGARAAAEDSVLGLILSKKYTINYQPDIAIQHIYPDSLPVFLKKSYLRGMTRTVIMIIFRENIKTSKNISYPYIALHIFFSIFLTAGIICALYSGKNVYFAGTLLLYLIYVFMNDLLYILKREKSMPLLIVSVMILYFRNLCFLAGFVKGIIYYCKYNKKFRAKRRAYLSW